jgi:hypothetical protein
MSMKTILVPIENHDAMQSALETALLLGRRCDSYIEGFALRWAINEFMVGDVVGGMPLETYRQDIAEEAKQARQIFESFMQKHDVPRSTETTESLSFGWLDDVSEGESFIGSYGRVFDVIVMNRRDAHSSPLHDRAIESGLFESGRPILLSPPLPPDCHQRVDRMELQHRAGTSHCSCDAASSESRSRYGPDGHWRNGSAGTLG